MFEAAEDVVAEAVAERGRVVGCPELDGGSNDWAEKKRIQNSDQTQKTYFVSIRYKESRRSLLLWTVDY
jgi:hypothetical protein